MIKKKTWGRIFAAINNISDKDWNKFLDKHQEARKSVIEKVAAKKLKSQIDKTDKERKALLNKMKEKEKTAKYIFTSVTNGKEYVLTDKGVEAINTFVDFVRAKRKQLVPNIEETQNPTEKLD